MIALKQPSLNEQLNFDKLILFRNGITFVFCYKLLLFLLQMI